MLSNNAKSIDYAQKVTRREKLISDSVWLLFIQLPDKTCKHATCQHVDWTPDITS